MTSGTTAVLAGVAMCASMVGQVMDYLWSSSAIAKGFKEVGPINSWVVKKWGLNGLPVATAIEAGVTLVGFGIAFSQAPVYGLAFAGGLAAAIWANNIHTLVVTKKI
jgi:hypothetical protein